MSDGRGGKRGENTAGEAVPAGAGRPVSAGDLMDSPRGRRLVLEYARLAADAVLPRHADDAQEFGDALFMAADLLDPDSGVLHVARYVLDDAPPPDLGFFGPGIASFFAARNAATTPDQPDEDGDAQAARAGALLGRLLPHLPRPSAGLLSQALMQAIGAARSWQEPDGDDLAAENPRLASALRRVAESLEGSGLLSDWAAPLDRAHQFTVEFDGPDSDDDTDTDSDGDGDGDGAPSQSGSIRGQLLRWWESTVDSEHREQHDRDRPLGSIGGDWWSAPLGDLPSTSGACPLAPDTPTGLWLVEDDDGGERAEVGAVRVAPDAPVYEIHEAADWVALVRAFPLDVTASRRHDWFNATGRRGRWLIPDWQQVGDRYAGVRVSLAGYLRTAGRALPVGGLEWLPDATGKTATGAPATLMAGWNPDQAYWLRDGMLAPAGPGRRWQWNDETDCWESTDRWDPNR